MKYIIVEQEIEGFRFPHAIVFSAKISHRDVARIHSASRGPWVVSAGFCQQYDADKTFRVWGESESLGGLSHRPEDAQIIFRSLFEDRP
jgi:hypothetical protein